VARRVAHRATRASVIAAGRLMGVLVSSGASTPTHRDSSSSGGGSSSQRLVIAADLLLLLFLVLVLILAATSLGSSAHFGFGTLPCLWSR
jgi:hypothetical protein